MGKHGIPTPINVGVVIYVILSAAFIIASVIFAYYQYEECTRVHPAWYCL